jgi:flagellar protein FliS
MFGSQKSAAQAYASVGVETGVVAASPHKLIVMLFDGAITAISNALQMLNAGDIAGKGASISHAITIIDSGLNASLDKKVGGEIAESLSALYSYMANRLLEANLQNDATMLHEVHRLLMDLRSAWIAIDDTQAPAGERVAPVTTLAPVAKKSGYETFAPRSAVFLSA